MPLALQYGMPACVAKAQVQNRAVSGGMALQTQPGGVNVWANVTRRYRRGPG